MATNLHPNEIRDYLQRAPLKWEYRDGRMVNNTHARLVWLSQIAFGTLHERINRRAGNPAQWRPWYNPVFKAVERHHRKLRKRYMPFVGGQFS